MNSTDTITLQTPASQPPRVARLTDAIRRPSRPTAPATGFPIGILPGEGIGPEVVKVDMDVLACVGEHTDCRFDITEGGPIGHAAAKSNGDDLSPEVIEFCEDLFARDGAVLCGPGGGRFVYDLRRQFDLFCKFTPVQSLSALADAGVIKAQTRQDVDIIVVRENVGGLYFGEWGQKDKDSAHHTFGYTLAQVSRILQVSITLAEQRRGRLMLALKPGGVPTISKLWSDCFSELTANTTLQAQVMEIDNAVYQVLENAREFDVIIAPNMFGDVLSDACSLLLASRGMSFSGNFNTEGLSVYQTGHGAAHDLTGKAQANPVGQILSTVMMLRESFALDQQADAIEAAVEHTLRQGWRTRDIAGPDSTVVGTRQLGELICSRLATLLTTASE